MKLFVARGSCACHRDVATESKALWTRVREGEIGCLFDEIQNLVEPIERLHMDVQAGPQRGRSRSVAVGVAPMTRRCRASAGARTARPDGEYWEGTFWDNTEMTESRT
jgi:hypothetical protein